MRLKRDCLSACSMVLKPITGERCVVIARGAVEIRFQGCRGWVSLKGKSGWRRDAIAIGKCILYTEVAPDNTTIAEDINAFCHAWPVRLQPVHILFCLKPTIVIDSHTPDLRLALVLLQTSIQVLPPLK